MYNFKAIMQLSVIPIIAIATGFIMAALADIGDRKMNEHRYNDIAPQCTCGQNNR